MEKLNSPTKSSRATNLYAQRSPPVLLLPAHGRHQRDVPPDGTSDPYRRLEAIARLHFSNPPSLRDALLAPTVAATQLRAVGDAHGCVQDVVTEGAVPERGERWRGAREEPRARQAEKSRSPPPEKLERDF